MKTIDRSCQSASRSSARPPAPAAARAPEEAARPAESSRRASASSCSATRARSTRSTRSSSTAAATSAWTAPANADPGRRRRRRERPGRRAPRLRLRAGLHRLRRLPLGDERREDLQDHGPRDEGRRAGRRPERLGRRADPGRRRVARPATPTSSCATRSPRASIPQISAILGPCAGGRRLLARDHGLRPDGPRARARCS